MQKFTEVNYSKEVIRKKYLIDAEGKVLGRLCTEIAKILRGKGKVAFAYHRDLGDHVVVVNAEKIQVTGRKLKQKSYTRYSGYPGGLKKRRLEELLKIHPTEVIRHAVKGMLPKTPLGRKIFGKLRVYIGKPESFPEKDYEPLKV